MEMEEEEEEDRVEWFETEGVVFVCLLGLRLLSICPLCLEGKG
jgi:hypothetical protein